MNNKDITQEKVILSLDGISLDRCDYLMNKLGESIYAVKIHELYDRHGPTVVKHLIDEGAPRVWVDAKLHDIPTTVALRSKALADNGAGIVTVHASGGVEMMKAAVENAPRVYAVTVLTSLDDKKTKSIYGKNRFGATIQFACESREAGVRGIVCSGKEVCHLPNAFNSTNPELEFIVPGIRLSDKDMDDHLQIHTPRHAIEDGATRLVIGRPITQADDAVEAFAQFAEEITSAKP